MEHLTFCIMETKLISACAMAGILANKRDLTGDRQS